MLVFTFKFMYNTYNAIVKYSTKEVCIVKSLRLVISLASAVLVLAAAICAVVIFQEELTKLYRSCSDYCRNIISGKKDEYADFVD